MVSNCSVLFFLAECSLGKVSERFNKKRPNKVKTVRIDAKQNTGSGAFLCHDGGSTSLIFIAFRALCELNHPNTPDTHTGDVG